ncbi:hypothetical protein [Hyphomicrobium sp. ghe19]|uniref:hypothetical protein n=1 Tax=Hyphomicrobium sp. ghe19 TaxID=2682968 RepID=UPI0013675529|nr:hypothetical protein HYPP_02654 [Hyphomicrobium sp. ghe19]
MATPKPKATINKTIDGFYAAIEEFRKLHPNITPNAILAFLIVATEPGITVGEVQKRLMSASSSTVRALALLSSTHRGGMDGLNLIRYDDDIKDRRVKHLYLKANGERVWSTLKKLLDVKEV